MILYYKSEGNPLEGGSRNTGEGVFMCRLAARAVKDAVVVVVVVRGFRGTRLGGGG